MTLTSKEYRAMQGGKPKQRKEESLQIQVAAYVRLKYPGLIFRSDFAAGIKMSISQALRHKKMQQGRAYPDFFLAKPMGSYSGLFLELKQSRDGVYLKDGSLSSNAHIQEQAATLQYLRLEGYRAEFACGFDEAVSIIEEYLKQ